MHQRGFASSIVAHQPDALSGINGEINSRKRADSAEMLFDAVQPDDIHGYFGHDTR
jgi:hypothetical protein